MKHRSAACPACGGPVEFKVSSSLVTVCEFCDSVVARADRKVEDHGKVADLVLTNSPLRRGMSGKFKHKRYDVVGRVQYGHPAGGVWDEWYLAFPGDKWGWLAEAQGKRYLMFERKLSGTTQLPAFDDLVVGRTVKLGKSEFTVAEKGVAKNRSAEGDIPWAFRPGGEHRYVDLSGPDGTFATFEYGDQPKAFVGKEVSIDDLNLDEDHSMVDQEHVPVAALQLNCPNCGGPLTLHAPDKAERVVCQSCNGMLDASEGKLSYLMTIKHAERLPIVIPIGTEGELNGVKYTVIGFLWRYALYAGQTFPWSEYLLYNPDVGFRWLVRNDRHWSFVEPVPVHEVSQTNSQATYKGKRFKVYDRGTAYVRAVLGEFYWQVFVGEQVRTADYIAPPEMISYEYGESSNSEEVTVSLGTYVEAEEIEKAFGLELVSKPWGVGVIQPRPNCGCMPFLMWPAFLFLLMLIKVIGGADGGLWFICMIVVSAFPIGIMVYNHSFEKKRWQDSDYSPYATE